MVFRVFSKDSKNDIIMSLAIVLGFVIIIILGNWKTALFLFIGFIFHELGHYWYVRTLVSSEDCTISLFPPGVSQRADREVFLYQAILYSLSGIILGLIIEIPLGLYLFGNTQWFYILIILSVFVGGSKDIMDAIGEIGEYIRMRRDDKDGNCN